MGIERLEKGWGRFLTTHTETKKLTLSLSTCFLYFLISSLRDLFFTLNK